MNEEITKLPAEYEEAARLHCAIVADAQAAAYHLISLGKNLKEMNEKKLYLQLGFSDIGAYAENAVGLKGRAVYNYIAAYENYGEDGLKKYGALGITKLTELLRLPPDERGELIESADKLSVRELKAKVDELKKKNEQLTFELEENRSADEIEAAKAEIEKLKAALEEEKKTKVLPAPELSAEEKKKLQKKLKEEAEKEVAKERQRAEKADAQAKAEAAKAEDERRKREIAERESKALTQKLEEARAENEKLQSNAKKPLPTQTKERVKTLISVALDSFTQAANAVKNADEAERGKLKAGLVKLAEELGKMAASL